jgi:hypothetical protein
MSQLLMPKEMQSLLRVQLTLRKVVYFTFKTKKNVFFLLVLERLFMEIIPVNKFPYLIITKYFFLGIIYNNQMDDFSQPGSPNFYGYAPSPANFIKPCKLNIYI